ncbi:MAG: glycerophosphodiester phosphodiesterase family protein [Bacteroidales bacterium]|nr:glycerophosphodiester phosphodiesterase family protein [Bacteroidales bacterium]
MKIFINFSGFNFNLTSIDMSVNKNKFSALILISICTVVFSCIQNRESSSTLSIGLDNYTIPLNTKSAIIGQLYCDSLTKKKNFKLVKDTSALFTINQNGFVTLKEGVELTSDSTVFVYGITIGVDDVSKEVELVKDEFMRNKIVAHRGAWKTGNVSENSLSALRHAIELGCGWSEFDVWLSANGVPVLSHDPVIGGLEVEKTDVSDLQKIELKNNDRVPTLKEYLLEIKKQNGTRLFLEMKPSGVSTERGLALAEECVKVVHAAKAQAWVNYISFDINILTKVIELDPYAQTAYLGNDIKIEELHDLGISGIDFHKSMFQEDDTLIESAKELGMSTNAWTVNESEEMEFLIALGLDYITTNEPELLKSILEEMAISPE